MSISKKLQEGSLKLLRKLKYDDTCKVSGNQLHAGEPAYYDGDAVDPVVVFRALMAKDDIKEYLDEAHHPFDKMAEGFLSDYKVVQLRDIIRVMKHRESTSWIGSAKKDELIRYIRTGKKSSDEQPDKEAEQPEPAKGSKNPAAQLQEALQGLMGDAVDRSTVKAMLEEHTDEILDLVADQKTTEVRVHKVKIENLDGSIRELEGMTHHQFEELMKPVKHGFHVLAFGETGGGKTHAMKQVARALGREFECVTLAPTSPASRLEGYTDATGDYVETALYRAVTDGKIFIADEIDNWNPSTAVILNTALDSSGVVNIPGKGVVEVHEDFLVAGCANTPLDGASERYQRMRQDEAFKDRFAVIEWEYDTGLERTLAVEQFDYDSDAVKCRKADIHRWVDICHKIRQKANDVGIDVVVSPRDIIRGAVYLAGDGATKKWIEMALHHFVIQKSKTRSVDEINVLLDGIL